MHSDAQKELMQHFLIHALNQQINPFIPSKTEFAQSRCYTVTYAPRQIRVSRLECLSGI